MPAVDPYVLMQTMACFHHERGERNLSVHLQVLQDAVKVVVVMKVRGGR